MVGRNFQIHGVQITGKWVSKYKNCIHDKYKKYKLLLIPQGNLSPSFSSIPPRLREFIPKLRFFENLPQAETGKSST